MSEYDFVYEKDTPEDIEYKIKSKQLDDFKWAITYNDMKWLIGHIESHPNVFSESIKHFIKGIK